MAAPALLLIILLGGWTTAFGSQTRRSHLFPVEKDGKWGFINSTGRIVIRLRFDSARDFHEGISLVTLQGKSALINTSGKIVFTPRFDIIHDFSEGLAAVNIGETRIPNVGLISNPGKWGYLDKSGKLRIPLNYTHAEDFSEGLAAVKDGDRGEFINHAGRVVFATPLDVTLGFHEGIVGVLNKGSISYFDRQGRKISPPIDYGPKSYSFSEGLVPISTKGKWGFMDKSGKIVIAASFEDAEDFSEGLAPVKVRSDQTTWCAPDESGSRSGFTMKWGFIDKRGLLVIAPQFESADPFHEGLAAIHNCGQSFFIDRTGKKIISENLTYASSFADGLANFQILTSDGVKSGYINKRGKIVWGPFK